MNTAVERREMLHAVRQHLADATAKVDELAAEEGAICLGLQTALAEAHERTMLMLRLNEVDIRDEEIPRRQPMRASNA